MYKMAFSFGYCSPVSHFDYYGLENVHAISNIDINRGLKSGNSRQKKSDVGSPELKS